MGPKQRIRPASRTTKLPDSRAKSGKRKKPKRMSKKQVDYLVSNLNTLDKSIMHSFITQDVESRASSQFGYYNARHELWCAWKSSSKLQLLLDHLSRVFVDLFQAHRTGPEPFARFLISWYESLGKLACSKMSDQTSAELWQQLCRGHFTDTGDEDRSALVFDVGSSCYTFMRKQVQRDN